MMHSFKEYPVLPIAFLVLLLLTVLSVETKAQELPEMPGFSQTPGPFTQNFSLEIQAAPGTQIYFTQNGQRPVQTGSHLYTGPINISGTRVIRAVAIDENGGRSEERTGIFTQLEPGLADFDSNLPLMIINQMNTQIGPGQQTVAYLSSFNFAGNNERVAINQLPEVQSRVRANVRGSSSQMFPKKMFAVRLIDENDENRNESLLDLPSENNWILYAPYSDKTLMRNVIAYRLSEMMGHYAPRTRFVEVFLHSGSGPVGMQHYHGVYVLVERIKWDNNRVNIEKIGPEDNQMPEISGGYIFKKDRLNDGESGFTTNRGSLFAHTRPQEADITPQQQNWLRNYVSEFESVLFGPNFFDPVNGYAKYIDIDSFIDYHLMVEAMKEIDGFRLSTYMYKDRGGKIVLGPVWDYNLSLGNANYVQGWSPSGWYHELITQEQYLWGWYTRLFQDPAFFQRWRARYWELRNGGIFSTPFLNDMIQGYASLLDEAQQRNFERWPILGEWIWPNYYVGQTYEDEVSWMNIWLSARMQWIDGQMGTPPPAQNRDLVQFWHFDNDIPNNTPLTELTASFTRMSGARIEFKSALDGYPFTSDHPMWRKASMERRNMPTDLNYIPDGNGGDEFDESAMRGIQIRQPFTGDAGENELIFHLPMRGSKGAVFSFAAINEGAATEIVADYSVEYDTEGNPIWTQTGLASPLLTLYRDYKRFEINFRSIGAVDFNENFKVRLRFNGPDMAADDGDRVTFNNIALEVTEVVTSAGGNDTENPDQVMLHQNYPNPFNSSTTLSFTLPESSHARLEVFNMLGQRVLLLVDDERTAGTHNIRLDAGRLSSGVYVYRLQTMGKTLSGKMMHLK
ncbi:MAG: CotH kinase family protein [Balneolales bacterium]|nr:CotH kinase family protein [Balneolales bacterium]